MAAGEQNSPASWQPPLPVDPMPGVPGGGAAATAPSEDEGGARAPRYATIAGAPVVLHRVAGTIFVELHGSEVEDGGQPVIFMMTQQQAALVGTRLQVFAGLVPGEPVAA